MITHTAGSSEMRLYSVDHGIKITPFNGTDGSLEVGNTGLGIKVFSFALGEYWLIRFLPDGNRRAVQGKDRQYISMFALGLSTLVDYWEREGSENGFPQLSLLSGITNRRMHVFCQRMFPPTIYTAEPFGEESFRGFLNFEMFLKDSATRERLSRIGQRSIIQGYTTTTPLTDFAEIL
ncbi:hypothetical protein HYS97_00730 [Candidatus Daviesbacteria bacterium]|nr:hypothetical protein [Candidatus Daviesbacteria bacterium]